MPERYERYGREWARLNPGWSVVDWTESELLTERWDNQRALDDLYRRDGGARTVELFVQLADVYGYELLTRFGGVYVNVDIEPIRPLSELDTLLDSVDSTWVAREDDQFLVNSAMSARAGDPFMTEVVRRLDARYFADPLGQMHHTTGPWLLTDTWLQWSASPVVPLPVEAFSPFHWSSVDPGGTAEGRSPPAGAFGIHHWGHRLDRRAHSIEDGLRRLAANSDSDVEELG